MVGHGNARSNARDRHGRQVMIVIAQSIFMYSSGKNNTSKVCIQPQYTLLTRYVLFKIVIKVRHGSGR